MTLIKLVLSLIISLNQQALMANPFDSPIYFRFFRRGISFEQDVVVETIPRDFDNCWTAL